MNKGMDRKPTVSLVGAYSEKSTQVIELLEVSGVSSAVVKGGTQGPEPYDLLCGLYLSIMGAIRILLDF